MASQKIKQKNRIIQTKRKTANKKDIHSNILQTPCMASQKMHGVSKDKTEKQNNTDEEQNS